MQIIQKFKAKVLVKFPPGPGSVTQAIKRVNIQIKYLKQSMTLSSKGLSSECVSGAYTPTPLDVFEICRSFDKMCRQNFLTQCCR